ncbi:small conductance mechanosensitive channel [Stenotrophomonas maltophilia]|uniref:mechanosensitive ion channel family protein n=1 Tax=Stenotrophomonas chelatiphaga TaxID=517011 RepID=UPI000F4B0C9D|nr:mechanosensitive ion channel domain-containing protein [Stenotrophomonas chelatiphaga]MCS4229594.1 small conductance mechanosensitive channel [Stenotrophomonas chelatiphaga]ROQ36836.1 small conductance mechanosensitive channel [Stenotrophomonas maltophilia]
MSAAAPTTAPAPALPASSWWHSLNWERIFETYGLPLIAAVVVLLVGIWLARRVSNVLPRATARIGMDPMLGSFMRNVVYAAALVIVAVLAIATLGVPISPLLAVLGTAGLAIGLALKDSLSNIASGVMLVTLRPFRVGDVVTVAGQTGTVRDVRIFQTVITGADNQHTTIPNTLITAAPIINLTAEPTRRVELVIGIGYEDDIQLARDTALAIMKADKRVLATPAPDVVVYELGAHSINLGIRCYVNAADHFGTKVTLLEQLKLGYDKAGINIPYPQQDMHLYLHGKDGSVTSGDALVRDPR